MENEGLMLEKKVGVSSNDGITYAVALGSVLTAAMFRQRSAARLPNLSANGSLRRLEKRLYEGAIPTKGETAKALEPFAVRHRRGLVEPVCELFEILSRDSAFGSPSEKVAKHRFRNLRPLYFWHWPA
jgi:hypothetical protein